MLHLTSPEATKTYEIDAYQMGWRLGGKVTSSHSTAPNYGKRVEEHGLHLLFGFYNRTLQTMKDMMGDEFKYWFQPHDVFTFVEIVNGRQVIWPLNFPPNDLTPGEAGRDPGALEYLKVVISLLKQTLFGTTPQPTADAAAAGDGDGEEDAAAAKGGSSDFEPPEVAGAIAAAEGFLKDLEGLLAVVNPFMMVHGASPSQNSTKSWWSNLLGELVKKAFGIFEPFFSQEVFDSAIGPILWRIPVYRRLACMFWMAYILGTNVVKALPGGVLNNEYWESLDDMDFYAYMMGEEWGCPSLVAHSVVPSVGYILSFSLPPTQIGAGTAMMMLLRVVLQYKGHLSFRMVTGMGDIVPIPMYRELLTRGVRFHFFHNVTNLVLGEDGNVAEVTMVKQATPTGAAGSYSPLVLMQVPPPPSFLELGWPEGKTVEVYTFPDHPLYEQLAEGADLEASGVDLEDPWSFQEWNNDPAREVVTLRGGAGNDFDAVVLNISVAGVKEVTPELQAASSTWADMVELPTIATTGIQVWLTEDAPGLNWTPPAEGDPYNINTAYLIGGLRNPFNTLGDYSFDTLAFEEWEGTSLSAAEQPKNCTYITCGWDAELQPYSDTGYPAQERLRVQGALEQWIRDSLYQVYPALKNADDTINWQYFVDPEGRTGAARLDAQWLRVNLSPSERYVLACPNDLQRRYYAGQVPEFPNLYLAGDWTRSPTTINFGYVDHAMTSGVECFNSLDGASSSSGGYALAAAAASEKAAGLAGAGAAAAASSIPYTVYANYPPFTLPMASAQSRASFFVVPGDYAAMVDALRKLSTHGVHLVPLLPQVLLTFTSLPDLASVNDTPGRTSNYQVTTYIVVSALSGSTASAVSLGTFLLPFYVFGSDPWMMVVGREQLGVDATLATAYAFPAATQEFQPGSSYSCDAKVTSAAGALSEDGRILALTVGEQTAEPETYTGQAAVDAAAAAIVAKLEAAAPTDVAAMVAALQAAGWGWAASALHMEDSEETWASEQWTWLLSNLGTKLIHLKQFPSITSSSVALACFRGLTTATMTVDSLELEVHSNSSTVDVNSWFWPHVGTDFGFATTGNAAPIALSLTGTFTYQTGTTLSAASLVAN